MLLNPIRAARLARGMNQTQFAKVLRVDQRTVSSWETGRREPGQEANARLARLGVDLVALANWFARQARDEINKAETGVYR